MTDEQTANVVNAINDALSENNATLGDTIWILSAMAVRFIEVTADKSAHNILKMELAQAIMESTTMTPLGQLVDLPPSLPLERETAMEIKKTFSNLTINYVTDKEFNGIIKPYK